MPCDASKWSLTLWIACGTGTLGCNAALDIHEPSDRQYEVIPEIVDAGVDATVFVPSIDDDAGADVERAWANWSMPNPRSTGLPNAAEYASDPRGFVTDSITHLQWEQPIDSASYAEPDAESYCAGLDLDDGPSFRLPTRIELLSLVDYTTFNPSISTQAFPATPPQYFWTVSPFSGDPASGWVVGFGSETGFVSSSPYNTELRVRCVR
jgi:hypothetical protein